MAGGRSDGEFAGGEPGDVAIGYWPRLAIDGKCAGVGEAEGAFGFKAIRGHKKRKRKQMSLIRFHDIVGDERKSMFADQNRIDHDRTCHPL